MITGPRAGLPEPRIWTPGRGAPRGPGNPWEKFRGNSGGPPGAPPGPPARAPPGAPPGTPLRRAQNGPPGGLYILYLVLKGAQKGVPGGWALCAPRGAPPGAPRGAKKCTFFWVFNNSPSRDSLGPFFGPPRDAQLGTEARLADWVSDYSTMRSMRYRVGPLGRRASAGTHRPALRPMGGTCPSEEVLPQGKDGSPRRTERLREGGGRLREPNAARRLE